MSDGYEFILEVAYRHSISPDRWAAALADNEGDRKAAMLSLITDWLDDWDGEAPYDDEVEIIDQWGFKGTIDEFEKEYKNESGLS